MVKINGLITLSKYPIKYVKLVFVSTNFEITILSTLTSHILTDYFAPENCSFATFVSTLSDLNIIIVSKKNLPVETYDSSNDFNLYSKLT